MMKNKTKKVCLVVLTLIILVSFPIQTHAVQNNSRSEDKQTISFEIVDSNKSHLNDSTTSSTSHGKNLLPKTGEIIANASNLGIGLAILSFALYLVKKRRGNEK